MTGNKLFIKSYKLVDKQDYMYIGILIANRNRTSFHIIYNVCNYSFNKTEYYVTKVT